MFLGVKDDLLWDIDGDMGFGGLYEGKLRLHDFLWNALPVYVCIGEDNIII